MNRKLKALGLALIASFAMTAVLASSAQAIFTSDQEHTILTGSQEGSHKFTAGSGFGAITCSTASFEGTAAKKEEEDQLINPTYSGCKDSLGRTVHVTPHSFQYTFTTNGTVHVKGTMILTVTSSGGGTACTVTIGEQTNSGIVFDNLGGTSGVRVTTNVTNVASTVEGGFFNCGTSTTNATAGTYEGVTIMTGKATNGAAAAISVDPQP